MTVLIIAAHPDDEILGAGGTIAKLSACGIAVHTLILAEGATSRADKREVETKRDELAGLAACARRAGAIIGASSVELEQFPDNRMDSVDLLDVVKVIERHIARVEPDTVFTHSMSDVNVDHRVIHDAVIAATRPQPGHGVRRVLFFEIMSSTEWRPPSSLPAFAPNYFVDITDYLEAKREALVAYEPEMRAWPHSRSVDALMHLARWRGATIGCAAAEAFAVGRMID